MRKLVAFFALLFICSITGVVKAQPGVNDVKAPEIKGNLLSFIDGVSFTPEGIVKPDVENKTVKAEAKPVTETEELIEKFSSVQFKYAMLLDVAVETIRNSSLYKLIEEWYGTHYRMGGMTKKGIDCSAFTGMLLTTVFAFAIPRTAREQYKICEHINKDDLLEGDLVFFNTRGGVSHVGLYLANGYFVHSSSSNGVKISSLNEDYYFRKFISGGRINQ